MPIDRIISARPLTQQEETFNISLRPKSLDECVGQPNLKDKLTIAIAAAKQRAEPLEHILADRSMARARSELFRPRDAGAANFSEQYR